MFYRFERRWRSRSSLTHSPCVAPKVISYSTDLVQNSFQFFVDLCKFGRSVSDWKRVKTKSFSLSQKHQNVKIEGDVSRGGDLAVNALAFYSVDQSSNPAEGFFCNILKEQKESVRHFTEMPLHKCK